LEKLSRDLHAQTYFHNNNTKTFFFKFETGSCHVTQVGLNLLGAGITGVCHHVWPLFFICLHLYWWFCCHFDTIQGSDTKLNHSEKEEKKDFHLKMFFDESVFNAQILSNIQFDKMGSTHKTLLQCLEESTYIELSTELATLKKEMTVERNLNLGIHN
jgi:hypothetical protein